jgi:hypothetical protein
MTSFHYLTLDEKIALIRDQGCHLMKSKKRKIRKKAENSSKNSKKAETEVEKWKSIFLRDFTISKSFNHFFIFLKFQNMENYYMRQR